MKIISNLNINAARTIRDALTSWDATDTALERLGKCFKSNTVLSDVLAKASGIDKLYSTRAGNIYWVSDAVVKTMTEIKDRQDKGETFDCVEIVDMISFYKTKLYPGSSRCASFASKYCHFFVPNWDFPIFDSFAKQAVNFLLVEKQYGMAPDRTEYGDFCERVNRLRNINPLEGVSARELDRYLWLLGMWNIQDGNASRVINEDVYHIFKSDDPFICKQISELVHFENSVT